VATFNAVLVSDAGDPFQP